MIRVFLEGEIMGLEGLRKEAVKNTPEVKKKVDMNNIPNLIDATGPGLNSSNSNFPDVPKEELWKKCTFKKPFGNKFLCSKFFCDCVKERCNVKFMQFKKDSD